MGVIIRDIDTAVGEVLLAEGTSYLGPGGRARKARQQAMSFTRHIGFVTHPSTSKLGITMDPKPNSNSLGSTQITRSRSYQMRSDKF